MEKKGEPDKPRPGPHRKSVNYDEYLMAMKRVHNRHAMRNSLHPDMQSPRDRHRQVGRNRQSGVEGVKGSWGTVNEAGRISTIASMVPDEIIYKHDDHSVRSYETVLMFIDVSGFTDLCENYTEAGRGGPSRLTQVLNSYIGAMIQEILTYNGDVLKFSGDAFLSMWKKTSSVSMNDIVHTAIDCALVIQKNYGSYYVTDVGVTLRVKIAISAGVSFFSIVGGGESSQASFVIVGQPVWDVKMAEYICQPGDILTAVSAWDYINESWYCTQPCGDGKHTKVLGIGATWKRVKIFNSPLAIAQEPSLIPRISYPKQTRNARGEEGEVHEVHFREFSLRPAIIAAMRSSWWPGLRRFMLTPVLRAVDNDEPMDFLTEVRRVIVVFMNIITNNVTEDVLIGVVDGAYKCVSSVTSNSGGLVNKVSMFDKDMMFLVVFGLRGLKHEDEAQKALQCAFQLKTSLNDVNIRSVSIGVTSGTTYCGVVGHVLRREYTVIGPAVNKAARMMMTYSDKVTCDKETFLRSKLDHEYFRLMETKLLKGIVNPGPIYEFNELGWHENGRSTWRHPLLGRNEELRKYKETLHNGLQHQYTSFTRYRDHIFAIAFIGPRGVGKTRLVEECLNITPTLIRIEKVILTAEAMVPYGLFRLIVARTLNGGKSRTSRENCENLIRYSIDLSTITPTQIHAINTIFDTRFPLPETYTYTGDLLSDFSVKNIIKEIFKTIYKQLWILAVEEAQNIDDESWRILLLLLATKTIFIVMSITDEEKLNPIAVSCLANNMIEKVKLNGIDRWYHAALACQLLDVQAIPPDLEKVIESASGGLPGWIQNFVISLVQRGALTVVTVPRSQAQATGAVMPSSALLQRAGYEVCAQNEEDIRITSYQSFFSLVSGNITDSTFNVTDADIVQMAVLAENYNFDDVTNDMAMDVIILKTYDSLTPFEKMLLKCASVLGDIFSRRMLLHLLQSDSCRNVAQAVAKLFAIRVLECEGGDFTRDTSLVLVHPAPALPSAKPPYCACLGTRQPSNCRDLPMYAFCGYMKFRHSLFRTTTYELLTENQKHEMHARALIFLERYTRRCYSCGSGCFMRLLGLRCDDGLVEESKELKQTRAQICALSAETRVPGEAIQASPFFQDNDLEFKMSLGEDSSSYERLEHEGAMANRLLGEYEKLYEAYLEYADLSIITLNIPQAVRLLFEVETFVKAHEFYKMNIRHEWVMNFQLAQISTLRGICMLRSGDLSEARKQLLLALKLYCVPFPTSKSMVRLASLVASLRQTMTLFTVPNHYMASDRKLDGYFFDEIASALNSLCLLFVEAKESENATLAAKLALSYGLKTNANFRVLCMSYGNLICTYRQKQAFTMCLKLEKKSLEMCRRKRGILEVTEVQAVCSLYTNIFLFYVDYGKKLESLEFGISVMHMMTNLTDQTTRQMLLIWMLKLLLSDLRINDMVSIMKEFFYMTDNYDLSSETWYYFYAMLIFLDTGYCVETYGTCERFYIKKGDAILRSNTPEAAWNFFATMWLMTIRIGAWEKSILWENKINQIMSAKRVTHEFYIMILLTLLEGLLITLVHEMNNWNVKNIIVLENSVKHMFKEVCSGCKEAPTYRPRYYLLLAYHNLIRGKKQRAYNLLNKSYEMAKQNSNGVLMIWSAHTRNHWKGTLSPKYINYWVEHTEMDNLLDYRDFDPEKVLIIPYTLPLPRDI